VQSEATAYLGSRSIARREPLYSANRFARFIGDIPADRVTTEHLEELRRRMLADNLKPRTIESTISDVITVVRWATGRVPDKGTMLTADQPEPVWVPADSINAVWSLASPMLRGFIALTYWTGFRQSDGMRWLLEHRAKAIPDVIRLTASKTGKHHMIPMPAWLQTILSENRYRLRTVSSFGKKCLRGEIHACCLRSGVKIWTPKNLRQTAVTEWMRANHAAGGIIHGCSLGVLVSYVAQLVILESAAPRVRVPQCFGASQTIDTESSLLSHFRRLDPSAQSLITGTAERLAAG